MSLKLEFPFVVFILSFDWRSCMWKKNYLVLSFLSWSLGGSKLARGSIMEARWLQLDPVTPDRRGNKGRKVGENKEENNTQMTFVEITVAQLPGDRWHCRPEFVVSVCPVSPGLCHVALPWEKASVTAIPPLILCVFCEISSPTFKTLVEHKTQGMIST